jgi:Fe-S cluster biogenesis protein NfuA
MLLEDDTLREQVAALDDLLQQVERIPDPSARDTALAAVQGLLELYGQGLAHLMARVADLGSPDLPAALAEDDLVAHLLLLHGLHPLDLEARVRQALDSVRPYLASHGGNVELLGIDDGVARLRLQGACTGCSSSETTLKNLIEQAIQVAAPDLDSIQTEMPAGPPPAAFIALDCLLPMAPSAA